MKQKWQIKNIHNDYELVDENEFRKIIEEVAKIVYADFCQLQKDLSFDSLDNEPKPLKKAG